MLLLLLPLMLPLQHCLFLPWSYEEVTRQVGWVWTVVRGLRAVRALLYAARACMHAAPEEEVWPMTVWLRAWCGVPFTAPFSPSHVEGMH